MAVKRQGVEVLSRGVLPPGIGDVGFDSSPTVATKHTIYELCLPSERGMDMEMNVADPVFRRKLQRHLWFGCSSLRARSDVIHGAPCGHDVSFFGTTAQILRHRGAATTCAWQCLAQEEVFTLHGLYDSSWDNVTLVTGKHTASDFSYTSDVVCAC